MVQNRDNGQSNLPSRSLRLPTDSEHLLSDTSLQGVRFYLCAFAYVVRVSWRILQNTSTLLLAGLVFVLLTMSDETLRRWTNSLLNSEADIAHSISALSEDEFNKLPLRWKQVLIEVGMSSDKYTERTKRIARELTLREIANIDKLARYTLANNTFAIHVRSGERKDTVGGLVLSELLRLEEVGIIEGTTASLNKPLFTSSDDQSQQVQWLIGQGYALYISANESTENYELPIVPLTEVGKTLAGLLRLQMDLVYLCNSAAQLRDSNTTVQVWGVYTFETNGNENIHTTVQLTDYCQSSTLIQEYI